MKKLLKSPINGSIVEINVDVGDLVQPEEEVLILEAMKMETALVADQMATVENIMVKKGDVVNKGDILLVLSTPLTTPSKQKLASTANNEDSQLIDEVNERRALLFDSARPHALAKRAAKGQQMARENISQLVDAGSFKEYGALIVAAQRSRRSMEDLIVNTPADGLITGTASINSHLFEDNTPTQAMIMAYDFTVLAGTQGTMNHQKMDRVIEIAKRNQLPIVLFGEGGGGRPGDVDVATIAGLFINTFVAYAGLDTPKIAIVSGYCFAGNAALVGSSDVVIATNNVSIGMGGPAMIEGGGLGKFHPKEVGPAEVHEENGVIDILVDDEAAAIEAAKKYLSYFQGRLKAFEVHDQSALQKLVPKNRKRTYDVRNAVKILADVDSVTELRKNYGKGLITSLIRVEGMPMGLIANNPNHEAGAITAENAIKAREFLELCSRFRLPVLSLVDTPGIMVGPDSEKSGNVKHASRLFNIGARMGVPFFSIVLRRAYGLGAMAMMGGSTHHGDFTIAWPTGEFGAMGLEGAVKLGYKRELAAETDEMKRKALYDKMVEEAYSRGKALSMAAMFEIDEVIDPVESRHWISMGLKTANSKTTH